MLQLMNKHKPILEVEEEGGKLLQMGQVLNKDFLPMQLQENLTLQSLNDWFSRRQIPEKREGLKEARMSFHGFETDRHFFSLSDQYWLKRTQKDSWEKLNFFTNRYSPEVGKIFFEPWNVRVDQIEAASPDRTTNGVLMKRWVQEKDLSSYLIKAGSVIYHQEPLSEVLASIMLAKMNFIDYVPYELVIDGMRFCSKCKNFVDADTEFVPASAIYLREPRKENETVYEHLIAMCQAYRIKDAKEMIDKMIVADHILCNSDRHLNNFGFIRSASSGKILRFAPLFDCGSSYWGTKNEVEKKKSNLFPEMEEELLAQAGKNGLLNGVRSTPAMKRLIQSYPDVAKKKKEALITEIQEIDLELEQRTGKEIETLAFDEPFMEEGDFLEERQESSKDISI